MAIAYLDCTAGAAGDMLLGAFVAAGLSLEVLGDAVDALGMSDEVRLEVTAVTRGGFQATRFTVRTLDAAPARAVPDILALIDRSKLPPGVRGASRASIERLAEVEGRLHGVPPEALHLHELAGADTIVDIVGFHVARESLGLTTIAVSPINVGSGAMRIAHGTVGVPGPATAELLRGAPIYGSDIAGEAITPTAALLLSGPPCAFGPLPAMRVSAIGYGAGSRDTPSPNVVRCYLGENTGATVGWSTETVTVLETNIDDLNPQVYAHVIERLLAEGALDAYLVPLVAKRGRPGVMLGVIAPHDRADALTSVIFAETPTLGVRRRTTERAALVRRSEERLTSVGTIRVKIASLPDGSERIVPEHADLARIAVERHLPLIEVARQVARELS